MAQQATDPQRALVGFGASSVALYLVPVEEKGGAFLKRNMVVEMPRDGNTRGDDVNVQYLRSLADAINAATAAFLANAKVSA